MPIANTKEIPIYDIQSSYNINIDTISYDNGYDFNEIHRHNYYEILFFEQGGGFQFIDFEKIQIKENSCYIVKPNQVHLVRRGKNADGLLIQFTNKMILPDVFLTTLSSLKHQVGNAVLFEEDPKNTALFITYLQNIQKIQESKSAFYKEKSIHLLSNILYSLEEIVHKDIATINTKTDRLLFKFIELAEENLTYFSVHEYAEKLHISSKKLGVLVKHQFGITPLKYLHNLLILNIKRDLIFDQLSLKEIAFQYRFDSSSNFSLFVKKQTGFSPSELQKQLLVS